MTIYRLTAIFDHDNGLPRDQVCSTIHVNDTDDDLDLEEAALAFRGFYVNAASTGRIPFTWLATTHDSVYVKVYEVNDQIIDGRLVSASGPPVHTSEVAVYGGARMSQSNLPAEVAVCLSMRDTTNVTVPKARRTGRIYFGPLNQGVMGEGGGLVQRPAANLNADLRAAAQGLSTAIAAAGGALVIYSRPFGGRPLTERPNRTPLAALPARAAAYYSVDQVWVDDAFDTQRRRGERATAKTTTVLA